MKNIRRRELPSGRVIYQVDLRKPDGRRDQRSFATEAEARRVLEREEVARQRHGVHAAEISALEMAEMITARERLRVAGATLVEAVEFYLAHGKRLLDPLRVPELARRFRESREDQDLSDKYVKQLKTSLAGLERRHARDWAHEITSRQIQEWLRSGGWGAKTRNNYLGDASAMFAWAMLPTQGHVRVNPCVGVERAPKAKKGKRPSLDAGQMGEMLQAAVAQGKWRVLAYVVLGGFGGLRPEEAAYHGMLWEDINLEERHVYLSDEVVKTGPGRTVDLTPQAVAWLRLIPVELRTGPVVPARNWPMAWLRFRYDLGWRVASDKVIKKQCLPKVEAVHGEWPNSMLRHTFASMHFAEHQNEALLQAQMGHESARMLRETYRGVRTRKEAAAFWGLAPGVHLEP